MGGRERSVNGGEGIHDNERPAATAAARVPMHRMFAFADRTDAALMAVGAAAAVGNGMAQPLMTFIFGDVIHAFGSAASSPEVLQKNVTKVRLCVLLSSCLFLGGKTRCGPKRRVSGLSKWNWAHHVGLGLGQGES